MSKGGGTTVQTPSLTQEQKDQIAAQTKFFTGTIQPTYETAVKGATDIYNVNAPGALAAAQNLGGTAMQAQEALGGTGESALRTGIAGLENLFSPDYEKNQIQAALAPAEAQYMQNVANQAAQFGGAGNLGSARQALAGRQLAGATQAQQMQTAAQLQSNIAAQRAGVANQLAQLGQGGIGQALGAATQGVTAAMTPQQLYNQYASVIFGTPAASYSPNFAGTQGSTTTGTNYGVNLGSGLGGSLLGGAMLGMFGGSDRRIKENVHKLGTVDGIAVYSFNYIWDQATARIGAMAQDLLEDPRYAHTVSVHKKGYYQVDYAQLPRLDQVLHAVQLH